MSAYGEGPLAATWGTENGRRIPIEWMQTQHICNSFNMIARQNKFNRNSIMTRFKTVPHKDVFQYMYDELVSRGAFDWNNNAPLSAAAQTIQVSNLRETPAQLCMLRALIDTKAGENEVRHFMASPVAYMTRNAEANDIVRAKFVEYRLAYPG